MKTENLTLQEIRDIYRQRLTDDFPRNERKTLGVIEKSIRKERYRCFGLKEADELLAYAFFVYLPENGKEYCLLDYYAVERKRRGTGIGSLFLKMLCTDQLKDADCALLEVEDPECAEEDRETRERRLRFYLRNGMTDTGVKAAVFGADFMILRMPVGEANADFRDIYQHFYRAILPGPVFRAAVRMKSETAT